MRAFIAEYSGGKVVIGKDRMIGEAGKKRIAATQKARWAKVKTEKTELKTLATA